MGLGSTAKKLQTVADTAEKLYTRLNDVRERLVETQDTVVESAERLDRIEAELAEQRAIVEAVAESEGIDLDAVAAEAHIGEAETAGDPAGETDDAPEREASGEDDADADADRDAGGGHEGPVDERGGS
jgi:DNA anti-recombination protein RmuC